MEPFTRREMLGGPVLYTLHPWEEAYPHIKAGISSRVGGVSKGDFASLNCGLHVQDDEDDVIRNRETIANSLNIPFENWTYAEQIHHNEIALVTSANKGRGRYNLDDAIAGKDALITDTSNICLSLIYADCVPVYFFDPQHQAIGLAHAGWKGTVTSICTNVVEQLKRNFNTDPQRLRAAIGPSIGMCCYEVDQRVIDRVNEIFSLNEVNDMGLYRKKGNGKYNLDLKQINRQIMIKAGITSGHIELSTICTSCQSADFFSHRKEQGKTGRMMAWIELGINNILLER